jgi:hypothetical protein
VRERRERAPWTVEAKALADAAAALGAK